MKFGMAFANVMTFAGQPGVVDLARHAEAAGFESLWTVEHTVVPGGYGSNASTASISTWAPRGRAATPIAARAGYGS